MALWGGRFEGKPDALFRALNDSLRFDWRLVRQDVQGSIAWAEALKGAGALNADESTRLVRALEEVGALAAKIGPNPPPDATDEDVHSWVEARLIERVGDLGKKLHTGRSRNDQVATDLRLWLRDEIDARVGEIRAAQRSLVALGEREIETILPGYTHLQRAQPVPMAHWCLAWVEMLERDASRFADARKRANECPLGSGALAGAAYKVDRTALARRLAFDSPTRNSLDAVADRDFVAEALATAALCAVHLSRLGEELVVFSSAEFGFFELPDAVATGSSLMPQKKNPDGAELLRAKPGRIIGSLTSILVTLKGLPLAYNKDLQEDKEPLFDAMDQLSLCLRVVPVALDGLKVRRDVCLAAAKGGQANATDLADYLVARGVPFRDAHEMVGRLVRVAIEKGCSLEELPLDSLKRIAPQVERDVYDAIRLETGLAKRDVLGGAAPTRVRQALADAKARLSRP